MGSSRSFHHLTRTPDNADSPYAPWPGLYIARPSAAGAVLADQIKSLDWRARKAKHFDVAPAEVVEEVLAKILTLVGEE